MGEINDSGWYQVNQEKERLEREVERLKDRVNELVGDKMGKDFTNRELREALEWVRRNVRHTNWEYVVVMIDKALNPRGPSLATKSPSDPE